MNEEELKHWWNNICTPSMKWFFCKTFYDKKWDDLTEAQKFKVKQISRYD